VSSASPLEAVLPSRTDQQMVHWLTMQMCQMYRAHHIGHENDEAYWRPKADELTREAAKMAMELVASSEAHNAQWQRRLGAGQALNDVSLGMSVQTHPIDGASIEIVWRIPDLKGAAGDEEHVVELWRTHFDDLKRMYLDGGHQPDLLLCRLFAMAKRYDSLSEDKSANQAALPRGMMATLKRRLGVDFECFASPLNRYKHFASFCSAWFDTDRFFGAVGSFQSFRPSCGSFECNPPFDKASICACVFHVASLLAAADGPMSFVVVIPAMEHSVDLSQAFAACAPYLVRHVEAPRGKHVYQMGLQHRRTGGGEMHWVPDKPSGIYFYQTTLGAVTYPVTSELVAELLHNFNPGSTSLPVEPQGGGHSPRSSGQSNESLDLADLLNLGLEGALTSSA